MKPHILLIGAMMIATKTAATELPELSTVQDLEGNTYKTVKIGKQTWLAENLRSTRFQNGEVIRTADIPDDELTNLLKYGRLYDWHDANDKRNICPMGWKIPSDDDWKELEEFIGIASKELDSRGWRGNNDIAITLKASQPDSLFKQFDQSKVNKFGFSATPAGVKVKGWYITQGAYTEFWSSSSASNQQAYARTLAYAWWNAHKGQIRRATLNKNYMFSVRCLKVDNNN